MVAAVAAGLTASAVASDRPALTAQLVKTGLYVISGGGCNAVLRLSANGFILVEGELSRDYELLMKKIEKITFSDQPVRAVILTDHLALDPDHNARFLEERVRIIAHDKTVRHLVNYTLPPITYKSDYKLRLGGVDVQLFHFGSAHTDGDTVVYFPVLKVVALGSLYSRTPHPDYAAGGSLVQ